MSGRKEGGSKPVTGVGLTPTPSPNLQRQDRDFPSRSFSPRKSLVTGGVRYPWFCVWTKTTVGEEKSDTSLSLPFTHLNNLFIIITTHVHWVPWGTGTPKDKDEVNKREVYECDGYVCDLEDVGDPSIFNVIHSVADLPRMLPTLDLSCEEKAARRKWNWSRWDCGNWTPEPTKKQLDQVQRR